VGQRPPPRLRQSLSFRPKLIVVRMYWMMLSTVIPFVAVSRQAPFYCAHDDPWPRGSHARRVAVAALRGRRAERAS
jgi:hypothetical protein